jgi:hypothetical protein
MTVKQDAIVVKWDCGNYPLRSVGKGWPINASFRRDTHLKRREHGSRLLSNEICVNETKK